MATVPSVKSVLDASIPQLKISFGTKDLENGEYISRAEATNAPTISWPSAPADPAKKYVHLNLDLDAPFVSFSIMSPILHSIWADCTLGTDGTVQHAAHVASKESIDWIKPGPPPGAAPHRYVSLLYEQPEGFNADKSVVPEGGMPRSKRIRFDAVGFEQKHKLGKPVAGGFFTSN